MTANGTPLPNVVSEEETSINSDQTFRLHLNSPVTFFQPFDEYGEEIDEFDEDIEVAALDMQPNVREREISILGFATHIVWFIFGLTPWLMVNALFAEIPILVTVSPEGYEIASSMALMVQIANIAPFVFLFAHSQLKSPVSYRFWIIAVSVLAISTSITASSGVLTGLSIELFGKHYSFSVLLIMFISGVVGCLAMVLYFPFVSFYKNTLITAVMSSGSAASALVAQSLAVAQNAGESPRFSLEVYFILITVMLLISLLCFIIITRLSISRKLFQKSNGLPDPEAEVLVNMHEGKSVHSEPPRERVIVVISENPGIFINQAIYNCAKFFLIGSLPFAFAHFNNDTTLLLYMGFTQSVSEMLGRLLSGVHRFAYYNLNVLSVFVVSLFCVLMFFTIRNDLELPQYVGWIIVGVNAAFIFFQGFANTTVWHVINEKKNIDSEQANQLAALTQQISAAVGTFVQFALVQSHVIRQ